MVQTRAITDGFDLYQGWGADGYGVASEYIVDNINWVSIIPGRFGGQALSGTQQNRNLRRLVGSQTEMVSGVAYYRSNQNYATSIFKFLSSNNNEQVRLDADVLGRLCIYTGAALIARTNETVLFGNVWHYVEFGAKIGDANGATIVKLDGEVIPELTLTNVDTKATADTDYGIAVLFHTGVDALDDYYCEVGGYAPVGEGRMETLPVASDVSTTGFVPSSGSRIYPTMANVPARTDTFSSGLVPGNQFRLGIKPLATVPEKIYGVQITSLSRKDEAGTRMVRNRLWSDDTAFTGAPQPCQLNSSTFKKDWLASDPDTTLAWTAAGVNESEIGVEITM